eukprot:gb/GECG01001973.1/.p1 GENE.gb/GECG01001973.1/~~gb/GECG01001973.1/.p1  ORF type:complete len:497 (+),score=50.55 gb/GECG01001973.1/:1-1491(+)
MLDSCIKASGGVSVSVALLILVCLSVPQAHGENPIRAELRDQIRKYAMRNVDMNQATKIAQEERQKYMRRVKTQGSNAPQQIHIAFAGRDENNVSNAMAMTWATVNQTETSIVKYGTRSGHYPHQVSGSCSTYLATWDHHAIIPNLEPNTRYYYIVGDKDDGYSEEYTFVTAPDNDPEQTVNVITIGDMGVYESSDVRSAISRNFDKFDFLWHFGDIAYADDAFLHHPFEFKYEDTWNFYFNWFQNVSAYKAYMACPGNHEAECHSPACIFDYNGLGVPLHNFTAYNNRFRLPGPESGGNNMWYSFNYGNIHFINIDSETNYPNSPNDEHIFLDNGGFWGNQLKWLEQDLIEANKDRHVRPWVVVAGHRPLYSVQLRGHSTMRDTFEKLLYDYKVDIYFCGHQHAYERQWPTYKGVPEKTYNNPRAPVYLVNGAGGDSEGHSTYNNVSGIPWNVYWNTANFGYGIITSLNSTALHWAFYGAVNDTKLDEITLYKQH